MDFRDIIENDINTKPLTLDVFIEDVEKFTCLDEALIDLPDRYVEYYFNNQDSLNKLITNFDVVVLEGEEQGYLGWQATQNVKKVIKYNGKVIVLEYDAELSLWIPHVAFRNIIKGLRYAKGLIDSI